MATCRPLEILIASLRGRRVARAAVALALFVASAPGALDGAPLAAARAASDSGGATATARSVAGLTPAEHAWLDAHPVVRLGINPAAPPFSYIERGRQQGVYTDLLHRLGRNLGIRFDPVVGPDWDELQAGVVGGQIVDVVGLLAPSADRAATMALTEPLTEVEYVLFVRGNESHSARASDLVNHRVAVVGSFAVRHWVERDYPGVQVVATRNNVEALEKLSLGEVDGAITTIGGASWYGRQHSVVNLRAAQVLYRTPLVAGVRRDWPELVKILDKAITQLDRNEVERIKARHFAIAQAGYSRDELAVAVALVVTLAACALVMLQARSIRRERKLHAALLQRETEYRLLVDHSLDGVMRTTPDGRILAANRAACAMFGLSEDELRDGGRERVVDADDPRLLALLHDREAHGQARGRLTMSRADGTRFEAELASAVYAGPDGQTENSLIVRDISERVRAEAELQLLQSCIENLDDIVMITEAEPFEEPGPRIVFVNPAFTRQTGYTREEALGRSPRFLQGPGTPPEVLQRIGEAMRRWEPVRAELVNYRKDGSPLWLDIQMVPIADMRGRYTHWVAIERDVTARRQGEAQRRELESQLRESQKMEAIGTLAGGVAHDFNNILGGVLGHVSMAQAELPADHPVQAHLAPIRHAGERARNLVRQILSFSRRQRTEMVVQPLAPVVREAVQLLRATLPTTVTMELSIAEHPLHALADATQLQQVMLNLCTNAWQAMSDHGGRLAVSLRLLDQSAPGQPVPGLMPGRYAELSVEDDGAGMDEATLERIFDPFFTTKRPGEGTGLGLAVVRGIVEAHQGSIAVHSRPGEGSRFVVRLPLAQTAGGDSATPALPLPAALGAGQQVLYVDDDMVMLVMVERLLQRLGYTPRCEESPRAALRALRTGAVRPDVVVTDFNMPDLSGIDVAREVRSLVPELPVIISSGFISPALEQQARTLGVSLLNKENTLEQLGPALQRALAAALVA